MAFAAPIAAEAAEAAEAAGARAAAGAAGKGAEKAAGGAAVKAPKGGGAGGKGGGGGVPDLPGVPEGGSWRKRSEGSGSKSKGSGSKLLKGDAGRWRRMMIAEFIICVILLGLSPLAKGVDEMGPVRFMKRGSATCAFFVILGLISSAGKGAAKATAMFGALVTLVLLVDQREAFGKLAKTLNASKDDDAKNAADDAAAQGPDDSVALDGQPGVAEA
jgi:hypothetical protein